MTFPRLIPAMLSRRVLDCPSDEAFLDLILRYSGNNAAVILAGGGTHELSTTSMAALRPVALFTGKKRNCRLTMSDAVIDMEADPFDILRRLTDALPDTTCEDDMAPLLAGYVAYEAGGLIETLPATTCDELRLPELLFLLPGLTLRHNRETDSVTLCEWTWKKDDGSVLMPMEQEQQGRCGGNAAASRSGTREQYLTAVERIREYIRDGEVYQVNLSQRFTLPLRNAALQLWRDLLQVNPAPFAAWIEAADHQVVCTSMERLFRVEGKRIQTRPIKGTRPRGATEQQDALLATELLSHPKDDAELAMIVDLERNDLGRICTTGSVIVREHKRLERYANVQHLVSVIEGEIQDGVGIDDIFRALFPGGSITGCPKIRAMEIIDELEAVTRHVYTGAIGYIAAPHRCDFNVAIRTAVIQNGLCHLSVGGGIVYDSVAAEEYAETLHKGRTFFSLLHIDAAFLEEE
jgi:para-aminobenzoate synthetase component I